MEELELYRISQEYAKYIYSIDNKIMKAFDEKNRRPFIRYYTKN